jgi:glyoxylase I family protein
MSRLRCRLVRSTGIHHVDLVATSIERSLPFYRDLLGPLGWTDVSEVEGERGETIWYITGPGTSLGLRRRQSDANPVPYDRYGVGVHHVCFEVDSRAVVDERAEWLRTRGVEIESGPKEYGYLPGYYAVFFYDPDGLKLELVHVPERG